MRAMADQDPGEPPRSSHAYPPPSANTPARTVGSHVQLVRPRLACSGATKLAFDPLLDDRLSQQPEARQRVPDHGRDPWPLRAPALALGPGRPPQVAMGQHDGCDV